jgi:hypothetical protein
VSHYDAVFTQGHKNAVVTAEYIDVVEPTAFDYQRYDNIKLKAGQPYTYVVNFEVYGRDEADTRTTSVAYRMTAKSSTNTARDIKANGNYTYVVNYTPETDVITSLLCHPNFGNNGTTKVPSKVKTRVMLIEGTYTADNVPAFVPCEKETVAIDLPETVYGGAYDWGTGVLTVTHAIKTLNSKSAISKYTTYEDGHIYQVTGLGYKANSNDGLCTHYEKASNYKTLNTIYFGNSLNINTT